jgi:hypothetical protein
MIVAFNEVPAKAAPEQEPPRSDALTTFLLRAFGAAEPGSRVWGSIFHWSDREFTSELRAIVCERKLQLHIVAGDRDHPVPDEVRRFFAACVRHGGVFRVRPIERRNHDKWFLFDRLDFSRLERSVAFGAEVLATVGRSESALYVSTANLSAADRSKNNVAIVIPVDHAAAALMKRRFEVLRWLYRVPRVLFPLAKFWFRRSVAFVEFENERFKLCLFPGSGVRDSLRDGLEAIEPRASPVTIRICANRWNRLPLAKVLFEKFREAPAATRIEIITRSPEDWYDLDEDGVYEAQEMTPEVADVLRRCSVRCFQRHAQDSETGAVLRRAGVTRKGHPVEVPVALANIHSKYVLIDDGKRHAVWVGSPNLVNGAVGTSFETLLLLKDEEGAYRAFERNFERLKTPLESGGLGATNAPLDPEPV